jgi:hypothetical protein
MTLAVFFKEWGSVTDWADWSNYLVNSSSLNKRVESENSGEAGLITFDNVSLEMRLHETNGSNSPVAVALNEATLDGKDRMMIQLRVYTSAVIYTTIYEGMIDLSTIEYPYNRSESGEIIETISFEVVDKLTAIALLEPLDLGRTILDGVNQVNATSLNTSAYLSGVVSGSIGTNTVIGEGTSF